MTAGLNDRTLFDQDHVPDEERQKEKKRQRGGFNPGVNRGPDHPAFDDEDDTSDVEDYMRQKDRQEQREREENSDMHAKAIKGADVVFMFRWAINAENPDIPIEARKEAQRCKARLKALARAGMTSDPSDEQFVALRDSPYAPEGWPFDDDLDEIPSSMTSQSDYEGYLADKWARRWRHVIPTEVLEEAQSADPSL